MNDVYLSSLIIFGVNTILLFFIYAFIASPSANLFPPVARVVFIIFCALFIIKNFIYLFFPAWGYDQNGLVRYGMCSFRVKNKYRWDQVRGIYIYGDYADRPFYWDRFSYVMEVSDGKLIPIQVFGTAQFSKVFFDVVTYVPKNNPDAVISNSVIWRYERIKRSLSA